MNKIELFNEIRESFLNKNLKWNEKKRMLSLINIYKNLLEIKDENKKINWEYNENKDNYFYKINNSTLNEIKKDNIITDYWFNIFKNSNFSEFKNDYNLFNYIENIILKKSKNETYLKIEFKKNLIIKNDFLELYCYYDSEEGELIKTNFIQNKIDFYQNKNFLVFDKQDKSFFKIFITTNLQEEEDNLTNKNKNQIPLFAINEYLDIWFSIYKDSFYYYIKYKEPLSKNYVEYSEDDEKDFNKLNLEEIKEED